MWAPCCTASGGVLRSRNCALASGTKSRSSVGGARLGRDKKKGPRQQASLVFLDESGYLLQPLRRRVWARSGHTPVQYASARHDRITALAALAKAPWPARFDLYCCLLDHNAHTDDVVQFLREVHRHLRRPIILVCDRLAAHRAAAKQLERQHAAWFSVEWLPAYAPEIDPVEYVWAQPNYGDLANFLPHDIGELRRAVERLIHAYQHDPQRLQSFFQAAQLVY